MDRWKELTQKDYPTSIKDVWDGDSKGSLWLDELMTEGDEMYRKLSAAKSWLKHHRRIPTDSEDWVLILEVLES